MSFTMHRHKLATGNQLSTETINEFLQAIKALSVDCNFQQVGAEEHREPYIRDILFAHFI